MLRLRRTILLARCVFGMALLLGASASEARKGEPPYSLAHPAKAGVDVAIVDGRQRGILSRPFVGYLVAVTIFTLGNSSDAFLLLRAHDAGLPTHAVPLLWSLQHVVKVAAGVWGGGLADRIGRRQALALGWMVYAAIYAGFAFVTDIKAIPR